MGIGGSAPVSGAKCWSIRSKYGGVYKVARLGPKQCWPRRGGVVLITSEFERLQCHAAHKHMASIWRRAFQLHAYAP